MRLVLHDRLAAVAVEAFVAEVALRRDLAVRALVRKLRRRRRVGPEQRPDRVLRLRVVAFAEVEVADVAALVDQVLGRPVLVVPGLPGDEVVVERDGVAHAELADVLAHVRRDALERELGRVDADDRQPGVAVPRVPGADMRQRAQAVDARVRPEVDQDDAAAQLLQRQRLRVEPARDPMEVRRRAVVLERPRVPPPVAWGSRPPVSLRSSRWAESERSKRFCNASV